MQGQTNKFIKRNKLAHKLRCNMTEAERLLWFHLRDKHMEFKFRRQHPYQNFILDFVCLEEKLVIELDGSQHMDQTERDNARTLILEKAGFRVLRFWNNEVLGELESVKEVIWEALHCQELLPHPYPVPPLEGEGTC